MVKSKSNGYKLARRFMNSKDIFKTVSNLQKQGYGYTIENTDETQPYYNLGYKQRLTVKYIGNDHTSVLPLYVYFKKSFRSDFKQDIQITYFY